jgi:hypothetical protein
MELYSFRTAADALFLLVALALAVISFLLVASALLDHLRNYKFPALQVRYSILTVVTMWNLAHSCVKLFAKVMLACRRAACASSCWRQSTPLCPGALLCRLAHCAGASASVSAVLWCWHAQQDSRAQ